MTDAAWCWTALGAAITPFRWQTQAGFSVFTHEKTQKSIKSTSLSPLLVWGIKWTRIPDMCRSRGGPDLKTGGDAVIIHTKGRTTRWEGHKVKHWKGHASQKKPNPATSKHVTLIMDLTCCSPTLTLVKRPVIAIPQTPRRAPPLVPNLGPVKLTWRHSAVAMMHSWAKDRLVR